MLREIGRWLAVNGEGVYDTRPWKVYGEGPTEVPEGAFTDTHRNPFTPADIPLHPQKGKTLYAFLLAYPQGEALIKSLASDRIASARHAGLGRGDQLASKRRWLAAVGAGHAALRSRLLLRD